jgi:hypothetical protein
MVPNFHDEMTFRDILEPAMDIAKRRDKAEAAQFIDAYAAHLMRRNQWGAEEALRVVLENLGYMAGYCGPAAMDEVRETFGARHPVFG